MKRKLTILCLSMLATVATMAQSTPFVKYDIISEEMEQVFLDHVETFACHLITSAGNQYLGQTDKEGNLYGYGRYVRADGTQIFGMFRNGELITGIALGKESATVGSKTFYSSYSLTSSNLDFVYQANQKHLYDTKALEDYRFVSMRYQNGDRYVGETYQGKRHGMGIYFYANGDIWFGQYDDNIRHGFGALFDTDNDLTIGVWLGNDTTRKIYVKRGK